MLLFGHKTCDAWLIDLGTNNRQTRATKVPIYGYLQ